MNEMMQIISDSEKKLSVLLGQSVKISILFNPIQQEQQLDIRSSEEILNELCLNEFKIDSLKSKSRKTFYVQARFCFAHIARKYLGLTYPDIARIVGLDHSTVISGISRCENLARQYKPFNYRLSHIEENFIKKMKINNIIDPEEAKQKLKSL